MDVHTKYFGVSLIDSCSHRLARSITLISLWRSLIKQWLYTPTLAHQELLHFSYSLQQLLHAGLPLIDALIEIRSASKQNKVRILLDGLLISIEGGANFSDALAAYHRSFDKVYVALVKVGEQTGNLDQVFAELTEMLRWRAELSAKVKQATTYPLLAAVVIIASSGFLMIYLVPQMMAFMVASGHPIPLYTKVLVLASQGLSSYGVWLVLAIIIVITITTLLAHQLFSFRVWLHHLNLVIWGWGPIVLRQKLARFARVFAAMYDAGIPVFQILVISQAGVGNIVLAQQIERARSLIEEGSNLSSAFSQMDLFPELMLRMLHLGETTGDLGTALRNLSEFYKQEVAHRVARLQSLTGPVLTILLAFIVAWISLSILGPIYRAVISLGVGI